MDATIVLEVPEHVSEPARKKAREAAVLTLWEEGAISTGVAAAEMGLSRHDFLDLLASKNIPVVRRPPNPERIKEASRKLSANPS
jgi:predicted HTH domain antitoxin